VVLAHQPDVLVLDLVMPGMAGEEIIESVKECCPETVLIVHSAFDPRYAVKSGARHFVSKGQLHQLERMLQRISGREVATSK
jgi:YesN/AraC family two-component response regulator